MWNDRLRFVERVEAEWKSLTEEQRGTARKALERLDDDPIAGAPLFEPLRGYWVVVAGSVRILYKVAPEGRAIVIMKLESVKEEKE